MASFTERLQKFKYDEPERRSPRLSRDGESATSSPAHSPLKRVRNDSPSSPVKRASPSPRSSRYAAPSRYAHLSPLVDALEPGLLVVFVGVNPGVSTALAGHAYAHPSNRFWHLLHVSGLTERKLSPTEDRELPRLYRYGHTNIVSRPTKDQSELSKQEMVNGAEVLEAKMRTFRPEVVCIVGKGIWEAIWKHKHGKPLQKDDFHYGFQDAENNMGQAKDFAGSRVFVATSTSGQAAALKPAEKEIIWRPLGEWVVERRQRLAAIESS